MSQFEQEPTTGVDISDDEDSDVVEDAEDQGAQPATVVETAEELETTGTE